MKKALLQSNIIIDKSFYKGLFLMMITISMFSSCSWWDKTPDKSTDNETLVHDGETREYILYVPAIYDGNSAVPLLFNFHGFGGTANDHLSWADMRSIADAENFILVYPQGTLLDGSSHWNAGLETPENKSDADDFGFIEALIDKIAADYSIDLERVYTCGYSNGAFFSYSLACFHSDKIAAIGSVSGTMLDETHDNCAPSHSMPMINIHGTADNVVPYNGGNGLKSIGDVLSYWTTFNNTDVNPTTNSFNDNGTTIEHFVYPNGDNGISIEHYKVNGGGHVWFDNDFNGSSTSRLIWDYVSKYDINGLIQ